MTDSVVRVPVPLAGRASADVDNEEVSNTAGTGGLAHRQRVAVASSVLPTGAATEATQASVLSALDAIEALATAIRDAIDGTQERDVTDRAARVLGHVVVDSSALPSGAATEATLSSVLAAVDALETLTAAVRDRLPAGGAATEATQIAAAQGVTRVRKRFDIPVTLASGTLYAGTAALGTADGAEAWTIKRVLFDANGNPTTEEWSSTTAVWNNRAAETYT